MKLFLRLKNLIRSIGAMINTPPVQLPPHCSNINALLLHLCNFDSELHMWALRWIAYPLRHPGAKMATCLLINGSPGTGMSLFFEGVVAKLYGDDARVMPGRALLGYFNSWAEGARFVIIDGGHSTHKSAAAQIKRLITSERTLIHAKFKDRKMAENQMNFVFITGEINAIPVGPNDHRFMVIEAPPPQETFFYRAVYDEIQNGGVDAFRQYLTVELDMADFDEHTMPPAAPHYRGDREAA